MYRTLLVLIFSILVLQGKAANIDTVSTYSPSMKKTIKAIVITPDSYDTATAVPVVYLLHGYSGTFKSWLKEAPEIAEYADQHNMIIVCPDGRNSWYFDSPEDQHLKYEQYIATELVSWIDKHYNTIESPQGRGITGLSMGGHGALYLAFKHQEVFGAAGSMSGGVDLRPFPQNWQLEERLGPYAVYPTRWNEHSVVNMTYLLKPQALALIIDCGTADFFYKVNTALHEKLLERNIPHDFISRPGSHNWKYWKNAIQYQLLFMKNFFTVKHTI